MADATAIAVHTVEDIDNLPDDDFGSKLVYFSDASVRATVPGAQTEWELLIDPQVQRRGLLQLTRMEVMNRLAILNAEQELAQRRIAIVDRLPEGATLDSDHEWLNLESEFLVRKSRIERFLARTARAKAELLVHWSGRQLAANTAVLDLIAAVREYLADEDADEDMLDRAAGAAESALAVLV